MARSSSLLAAVAAAVAAMHCASAAATPFAGKFVTGVAANASGTRFLERLDMARRMFSAGDPELMTFTSVYDSDHFGATEGSVWVGNFWTQNSYGVGFASLPFLPQPQLQWMQTSFLWWFDHMGDGGQTYGGMPDTPDGMLCDNGSPTGCNYMQCGAGRRRQLTKRNDSSALPQPLSFPSKRHDALKRWEATQDFARNTSEGLPTLAELKQQQQRVGAGADTGDTPGLGHDWMIGGTLAGGVMQAEMLLTTRNMSAVRHFLPMLARISGFMEGRRVQDASPRTPGAKGLFRAGNGADLLAPSFGGWPLPVGCVVTKDFSNCTQRAMSYLTELTVTYSALLDRMIELERLLYPGGNHNCTSPNGLAKGPAGCLEIYQARRQLNDASLTAMMAVMNATKSVYLIRAMDPNGEKHGVYAPRPPCPVDEPCPLAARHGYFESAPNHDAVGLRVADDALAQSIYTSMLAVDGLRPCDWTIPNFPDYDDSCGDCDGGFGTWVSGGSWSTAEARAILAHYRGGRPDLAANSMGRILDPYAKLFKLDNPIAHQGCGPGMYAQSNGGMLDNKLGAPILDVDIFGIPAAFLHGLFGYQYRSDALVLEPTLPGGVTSLMQKFPVRFGNSSLFLSMEGFPPPPTPPPPPPPPGRPSKRWSCQLFGCTCQGMKNFYGAYAGIGFGCAPKEAQMWWDVQGPGAGCGPYPAPKPNCSFCGGRACTKSNPCFTEHNPTGVCKPGYNFVCDLCQDNATCNDLPARCPGCPVPLPALSYEWWQMPIKVEINGVACKTCLDAIKPRQVTLKFVQLQLQGVAHVHITFGKSPARMQAQELRSGHAAYESWSQSQAERSSVSLDAIATGCVPPAAAREALTNSSAFSAAMAAAGLSERFEAQQAAAYREALNASVTRCDGRASGAIAGIPAEPTSWKKYNMKYNQSAADAYFTDAYNRIWNGLVNLVAAYESPSSGLAHTPLQMQIVALFRGKSVAEAQDVALALERKEADAAVAELKQQLGEAEAARAKLERP